MRPASRSSRAPCARDLLRCASSKGGIQMKAARISKFGPAGVVELCDTARPAVRTNQVLIGVRGSSINPIDIAIREGRMKDAYHLEPPFTLGYDVAGVIAEVGPDVQGFAVGD